MFQRACFAAQSLGIAERTHQQMFDAVWKTGELATIDAETHRLRTRNRRSSRRRRAYARWTGVSPQHFLAMANSFGVDGKMRSADAQIFAMQVPDPYIIVNGNYRIATAYAQRSAHRAGQVPDRQGERPLTGGALAAKRRVAPRRRSAERRGARDDLGEAASSTSSVRSWISAGETSRPERVRIGKVSVASVT